MRPSHESSLPLIAAIVVSAVIASAAIATGSQAQSTRAASAGTNVTEVK